MPISVTEKKATAYVKTGADTADKLLYETSGEQVKLKKQNGVTQDDVQKELEAIHAEVTGLPASMDAMVYKGKVNSDGDIPATYSVGWAWRVATAGTYKGAKCEVGDLIVANTAREGSGSVNSDFDFYQGNLDGVVIGPESATADNIALFDSATGKLIKDSGVALADLQKATEAADKQWVVSAGTLPDTAPEELADGGLLLVTTAVGG